MVPGSSTDIALAAAMSLVMAKVLKKYMGMSSAGLLVVPESHIFKWPS